MNETSICRLPVLTNDLRDLHLGHLIGHVGMHFQLLDFVRFGRLLRPRMGARPDEWSRESIVVIRAVVQQHPLSEEQ